MIKDSSSEDEDEDEVNIQKKFSEDEEVELSLNAMTGAPKPATMRLMAWIGKHEVTLLVDIGSSHNFINSNIIRKVGLQCTKVKSFEVKVANGEKLKCEKIVLNIKINVQVYELLLICMYFL